MTILTKMTSGENSCDFRFLYASSRITTITSMSQIDKSDFMCRCTRTKSDSANNSELHNTPNCEHLSQIMLKMRKI